MLLRSGIVISFFTFLCRIFGLIREFFVAAAFGTSVVADCVNVAFKIPNLFRRIFGEGALASVFIPIFTDKLLNDSKQEAEIFSHKILTLLILILGLIIFILEIYMPYFMAIIAPGFYQDQEKFDLAVALVRITTPYLLLISVAALIGGILNSVKKFAAFAFMPIFMSLCVVFGIYVSSNENVAYYACYALVFSGVLQCLFMIFCAYRAGFGIKLNTKIFDASVIKLIHKMGPATLAAGAQQLNLFISQSIASFLPGAVSILSYADRLYQFPLAIIGVSFSTVLLPELSALKNAANKEKVNEIYNKAMQLAMLISLPAAVGLGLLSKPIIHLLYERGAFTYEDSILTSYVLSAFSLGLPAFVLAKVFTPIYYANLDTVTPFRISLCSFAINTVLNIIFIWLLGHVGIALATSFAAWINIYMLWLGVRKNFALYLGWQTIMAIAKIMLASVIMGFIVYAMNEYYQNMIYSGNVFWKMMIIAYVILVGIMAFIISALGLKLHKMLK
jgi:putative peptidoglycan lipid II flippase